MADEKWFRILFSSHIHASCSTHSSTRPNSFFTIMYGACKSQSFRRNTRYDKRPFLLRVLWCHSTKLLRTVSGKFKREILAEARSPLLCTADRHYQVSQERLTFAKNLKDERNYPVRFLSFSFLINIFATKRLGRVFREYLCRTWRTI